MLYRGLYRDYSGVIYGGPYRDNGKENGNYYNAVLILNYKRRFYIHCLESLSKAHLDSSSHKDSHKTPVPELPARNDRNELLACSRFCHAVQDTNLHAFDLKALR